MGAADSEHNSMETSRREFLRRFGILGAGLASQVGIAADAQEQNQIKQAETPAPVPKPASVPQSAPETGERSGLRAPASKRIEAYVRLNQCGYLPAEPKRAVIPATGSIPGAAFCIIDDDVTPEIRYRGRLAEYDDPEARRYGHFDHHFFAEFDGFDRPGRYRLRLSDGRLSAPFSIGNDVYARLIPLMLRFFDVQRCGHCYPDLHGHCHLDDGIVTNGLRAGERIDCSGGWHDAGDYLKFVETASYVTAILLFAYDRFPHVFHDREHRGRLPVLLRHARVGVEWLLKMHPAPGEFYYQVGDDKDHDSWRLPERDCSSLCSTWKPRPVYAGVGANLAGRTAAALAIAARAYRPFDHRLADRCQTAARSAYQLGLANRRVVTTEPYDFYPETTWEDDMAWGAAALYHTTGIPSYLSEALEFSRAAGPAMDTTSVYNTHAIAHLTLYPFAPEAEKQRLREHLRADAEHVMRTARNPYSLGTPYVWGTAEAATGAALTCLFYNAVINDSRAENAWTELARRQRDFVLGCNPFGLSCLIGAGTRYPLFPHHQIANIKNMELSGAIVGGPTSMRAFKEQKIPLDDVEFSTQTPSPPTETDREDEVGVYHDAVQDYVTNEPAIDYTAKFLLLTAFFHPATPQKEFDDNALHL